MARVLPLPNLILRKFTLTVRNLDFCWIFLHNDFQDFSIEDSDEFRFFCAGLANNRRLQKLELSVATLFNHFCIALLLTARTAGSSAAVYERSRYWCLAHPNLEESGYFGSFRVLMLEYTQKHSQIVADFFLYFTIFLGGLAKHNGGSLRTK